MSAIGVDKDGVNDELRLRFDWLASACDATSTLNEHGIQAVSTAIFMPITLTVSVPLQAVLNSLGAPLVSELEALLQMAQV